MNLPAQGGTKFAVRYAAGQRLPVRLLINREDAKEVCGMPTGGWRDQHWDDAGVFRMARGVTRIGLLTYGAVPPISMLRVTAAE